VTKPAIPVPRDDPREVSRAQPRRPLATGDPVPPGDAPPAIEHRLNGSPGPEGFAAIAQKLMASTSEQPTIRRVVELAVETVQQCHVAGVSLRHGNGRVDSPAVTDEVVAKADELQYELQEGPCLDAIRADELYVVGDLANDPRWPRWGPEAARLGLASILSVRLSTPHGVVGALNLYSREKDAFDDDSVQVAYVYASHAANALWATREVEGLRTAMRSRHLIGMAQGMLMERHGLTEDSSFEVLRRYSQMHNVKLRDVAAQVLAQRGDGDTTAPLS
jgi:GAF domain-containing protein